jgi:hypothetical protein
MHPRLAQVLGLIFLVVTVAMTLIVYDAAMGVSGEPSVVLASSIISWGILALPEFVIGLWLLIKGTREAKVGDVSGDLIQIVQREGRINVDAAARELDVDPVLVVDAAEKLAKRRLPLVYLDQDSWEIVSPKAATLQESILHLLHAQRRMTFEQISMVTESTDKQIIDALKELSEKGRFRGTIDENSRVVYTAEAVSQLPKAVTECPNCGGKLSEPVLPGEEEACPYCGHIITNKVRW